MGSSVEIIGQRRGLVGSDQRAVRDGGGADTPGEGRDHLGVAQIDLGGFDIGAIGFDDALIRTHQRDLGVQRLLRNRVLSHQRLVAFEIEPGIDQIGLGLGELPGGLVQRRLIGPGIDLIERLAGLDDAAFGEEALLDDAGDLRLDVGDGERIGAARQFSRELHRLFAHHHEAHHRRGALWMWRAASAKRRRYGRDDRKLA